MDDLAAVQIFSLLSKSPSLAHLAMENASVIRSRLPPHPVVVPGPVVAIRVGRGKDEPVGVVEQVGVGRVVLHQLLEHPRGGGRRDPLTSVDPSVDPHCRLASTFTPAMSRGKENLQQIFSTSEIQSCTCKSWQPSSACPPRSAQSPPLSQSRTLPRCSRGRCTCQSGDIIGNATWLSYSSTHMSSSEWYSVQVIACRGAILVICHLSGAAGIFEARFVYFSLQGIVSCHLFLLNQLLDIPDVQAMLDVPVFLHILVVMKSDFPKFTVV